MPYRFLCNLLSLSVISARKGSLLFVVDDDANDKHNNSGGDNGDNIKPGGAATTERGESRLLQQK